MPSRRRNVAVAGALLFGVAAMIGLTAASVPLYRLFCQATGYGGTTQRATSAPAHAIAERLITVRFDASTAPDLDWEFRPLELAVRVHPGEEKVVTYRAVNRSREPITGTATFNVTPGKAGLYFDKLQCFCFTKQRLAPGESADLSVSFFVDPDILSDANTADVDTITLAYTMFRAKDDAKESEATLRSSALSAKPSPAN
jgi:cytochrome c oxidase assembly protein subunit 11